MKTARKNVLVVQHFECEVPGWWGEFYEESGIKMTMVCPHEGEKVPPVADGFGAVMSLGGPMNVWEESKHPWLRDENRLIRHCLENDVPFMGICLGAQLLAKAARADVMPSVVPEVGWYPVALTQAGQADPLFAGLPRSFPVLHWHGDMFEVPTNTPYGPAMRLASSDFVPNQALRIGHRAYGLQFHVEVSPTQLDGWIMDFADYLQHERAAQSAEVMRAKALQCETEFKSHSRRIFDNFCAIAGLAVASRANIATEPVLRESLAPSLVEGVLL